MKFKSSIIVLLITALIFTIPVMAAEDGESNTTKQTQQSQPQQPQKPQEQVVATVNGQELTMKELDQFAGIQQLVMSLYQSNRQFAQLLLQTKSGRNLIDKYKKQKLEDLIKQTLLENEAENRELSISDKEKDKLFNDYISQIKKQNNMTDKQILDALKQQGITSMDQFKQLYFERNKGTMLVNRLQEKVTDDISISDKKAEKYYNNNKDQFTNKDDKTKSFKEVKKQIKQQLNNQESQKVWQDFIKKLKDDADIDKKL